MANEHEIDLRLDALVVKMVADDLGFEKTRRKRKFAELYILDTQETLSVVEEYRHNTDHAILDRTAWFNAMVGHYAADRFPTRFQLTAVLGRTLRECGDRISIVFEMGVGETYEEWVKRALTHPVMSCLISGYRYTVVTDKLMMEVY